MPQHEHISGLPIGTRGGTAFRHHFPLDGEYVIKLRLWKTSVGYVRGLQTEHDLEVSIDGQPVLQTPVGGPSDYQMNVLNSGAAETALETRLRTRTRVTAGPHDVVATFLALAGGVRTGPEGLRPTMFAVDPLYIHGVPAIERVIIEGPYNPTGPGDTPSRRAIFTCKPGTASDELPCARTILSRLTQRAYRRASTEADLRPLLDLFRKGRANASFEAGIQLALQGVLTSPKFLFRVESDPPNLAAATHRVSSVDLASRLSFFLWSSIPDQELLDAAAGNQLGQPAVIERQVRRMLARPAGAVAGEELRRPVAAPAQPRGVRADTRRLPGVRRRAPSGDAHARRRCCSTACGSKTAASSTCCAPTTPSRTSGWRGTTGCAASTAVTSGGCR